MQTNQYLLFLHAACSLLVHARQWRLMTASPCDSTWRENVLVERFTRRWGENSVSAYSISCMFCQHCSRGLGGQFSIVCIQSMIIIIISLLLSSDHTVQCNPVESACTTMTSDPPCSPLWAPPPIVRAYTRWAKSFLVCVFVSFVVSKEAREQRSLQFIFLCQRLFFLKKKGKESNHCHMIAFLFWTDTVQSRKTA